MSSLSVYMHPWDAPLEHVFCLYVHPWNSYAHLSPLLQSRLLSVDGAPLYIRWGSPLPRHCLVELGPTRPFAGDQSREMKAVALPVLVKDGLMGVAMWRWEGSVVDGSTEETHPPMARVGGTVKPPSGGLRQPGGVDADDAKLSSGRATGRCSNGRWPWLVLLLTQHNHGAAEEIH